MIFIVRDIFEVSEDDHSNHLPSPDPVLEEPTLHFANA